MRKPNPQHRWHLTAEEIEKIAALRSQGHSQTEIGKRLKITRNSVAVALKKLGLPTLRPLAHQEQILALLNQSIERRIIARMLKVPYRSVYRFARERGFGRPRKQFSVEQLIEDIVNHRGSGIALAKKHGASYRKVLQLAHTVLACERFLPVWKNPLRSDFPQKHYDRVN